MGVKQNSIWRILLLAIIVVAIAFVMGVFGKQYALKGAFQDSGKHGLKIWYTTLVRAGYPIISQTSDVTDEKLSPIEQLTKMSDSEIAFTKDQSLHIVPMSAPADVLVARIESLQAAGNEVVGLRFDMAFDLRVYEDVTLEGGLFLESSPETSSITGIKIFNGFVLRNQAIAFERPLATKVTAAIDAYAKEKGLKHWVYHDDLITSSPQNQHWLQIVPLGIQLLFFQCMIGLFLYFMYKGRTFGFLKEDYEETERTPAAFLIAVASYYKRYRCYDQVTQAFWDALTKLLPKDPLKWDQYAQDYQFSLAQLEKLHQMALANWPENRLGLMLKNCAAMHQITLILRKSRLKKWHKQSSNN